jgi:parallel beta-helix repeat protein
MDCAGLFTYLDSICNFRDMCIKINFGKNNHRVKVYNPVSGLWEARETTTFIGETDPYEIAGINDVWMRLTDDDFVIYVKGDRGWIAERVVGSPPVEPPPVDPIPDNPPDINPDNFEAIAPYAISGKNNILIEEKIITSSTVEGIRFNNCHNVTIRNCIIKNCVQAGLSFYNCSNILIEDCFFDYNRTHVRFGLCTGPIIVRHNDGKNVRGPAYPGGQFCQLAECGGAGVVIEYNYIKNWPGQSDPEDMINIYKSFFPAESPAIVRYNYGTGYNASASGGGFLIGDGHGAHQILEHNVLVNPGQYGIGSGGQYITMRHNKVFSQRTPISNTGVSINTWYTANNDCGWGFGGDCIGQLFENNQIKWTNKNGVNSPSAICGITWGEPCGCAKPCKFVKDPINDSGNDWNADIDAFMIPPTGCGVRTWKTGLSSNHSPYIP